MINSLKKKRKKGFTLIELIIVIAIIAILAAIAVPQFSKIREKANISTDISNAKAIHSTVATGIASEEIILPADKEYYELSSVGVGTVGNGAINVESSIDGKVVPKAIQQSRFVVGIDASGNITIEVLPTATGTPATGTVVYPNPATSSIYGK